MKDIFSTSKLMNDLNTMFSTPEVDPAKLVYKEPKEQKLENSDFDAEPILKLLDIVKSGVERYSNSSNKKNTSYLRNNLLKLRTLIDKTLDIMDKYDKKLDRNKGEVSEVVACADNENNVT